MTEIDRTVDSDGVNLAVHEYGDLAAPTIMLVHGYPDTSTVWDEVVALLTPRFHVVTYDVRGAGRSDRPQRLEDYRLDQLARDLRAVAAAVSPDRPVHVVGHDWGSIQSWEAVTDPGAERRIASFTSLSGPSLDHVGHWFRARRTRHPRDLVALVRQIRKSWYIGFFHLPWLAPMAWRHGLGTSFGPSLERLEGVAPTDTYPAPTLAEDGATGVRLYRANLGSRSGQPGIRTTTVPVQIVVALNDRFVSPSLAVAALPWVDRVWVRRVHGGHWLQRQAPTVFATAITDLVDHVEGGDEGGDEPRSLRRLRTGKGAGEFAGQLVVVTGAGSGIGRETTLALARLGADIVVADVNEAAANESAALVRALGVSAHVYAVDVSDVTAMERFASWVITERGVPDVVVNNAGIGVAGAFLDTTAADWQRIVDVNLHGVVHGCRLFGAAMAERLEGGQIVNVASAAAFTPSRTLAAYGATKAAVLMLSESLRAELSDVGVGVSAICPGIVNTNITTATRYVGLADDAAAERGRDVAKLYARRNYPPSKVADAIVKAVRTNAAVVPVTPEAVGARLLSRLSPRAMRALAKLDVF
jgi:NAD(P)-dependent dehydrogenase (short-subunit alcohol dehydrogenase family)/pimeloyl-ACP methyl ester carboxylesterase